MGIFGCNKCKEKADVILDLKRTVEKILGLSEEQGKTIAMQKDLLKKQSDTIDNAITRINNLQGQNNRLIIEIAHLRSKENEKV